MLEDGVSCENWPGLHLSRVVAEAEAGEPELPPSELCVRLSSLPLGRKREYFLFHENDMNLAAEVQTC